MLKDIFFISVLKQFDYFLVQKENYVLKRICYSPITDDNYEVYYEAHSSWKIGISFILHKYHEDLQLRYETPVSIIFSRPKYSLLNFFSIEYSGYHTDSRKYFSLEFFLGRIGYPNFMNQEITENSIEQILEKSKSIMESHFLPIIRGEAWIDELIKQRK